MPLTRDEATDTLRNIDQASRRSASAFGYSMASPHLILWGAIWVVGYGVTYFAPEWAEYWPVLVVLGFAVSTYIGRRMNSRTIGSSTYDWRYAATFVLIFAFVTALFSIMPPSNGLQAAAFTPLFVGLMYGTIGLWTRAWRIFWLGLAVGVLTVIGYFYFQPYFLAWLAVLGGGALILGGLWLRRT